MNKHTLFLLLLIFSVTANISWAQNSIFAGKIVDENNDPIAGATIRVGKADRVVETKSDDNGLFYTQLLPSNTYHVDAIIDGKYKRARRVYLAPTDKKKIYYCLKVAGDRLLVRADGVDPFMKHRLSKIEAARSNDVDGEPFLLEFDMLTGKPNSVSAPPYKFYILKPEQK